MHVAIQKVECDSLNSGLETNFQLSSIVACERLMSLPKKFYARQTFFRGAVMGREGEGGTCNTCYLFGCFVTNLLLFTYV